MPLIRVSMLNRSQPTEDSYSRSTLQANVGEVADGVKQQHLCSVWALKAEEWDSLIEIVRHETFLVNVKSRSSILFFDLFSALLLQIYIYSPSFSLLKKKKKIK